MLIDGYFIRSLVATVLLLGSVVACIIIGVYLTGPVGLGILVLTVLALFAYFYRWGRIFTALFRPESKGTEGGKTLIHEEKPWKAEV